MGAHAGLIKTSAFLDAGWIATQSGRSIASPEDATLVLLSLGDVRHIEPSPAFDSTSFLEAMPFLTPDIPHALVGFELLSRYSLGRNDLLPVDEQLLPPETPTQVRKRLTRWLLDRCSSLFEEGDYASAYLALQLAREHCTPKHIQEVTLWQVVLLRAGLPSWSSPDAAAITESASTLLDPPLGDAVRLEMTLTLAAMGETERAATLMQGWQLSNWTNWQAKQTAKAYLISLDTLPDANASPSSLPVQPRLASLTATFGQRRFVSPYRRFRDGAPAVVVTDSALTLPTDFEVLLSPYAHADSRSSARFVKTHPAIFCGDAEIVVWVDANIAVSPDAMHSFVAEALSSGAHVSGFRHQDRGDPFEEGDACVRFGKEQPDVVSRQLRTYSGLDLDGVPLIETGVLVYKLDAPETHTFLRTWWGEICNHSARDQLSFQAAAKHSRIKVHVLRSGTGIRDQEDLAVLPHATSPVRYPHVEAPKARGQQEATRERKSPAFPRRFNLPRSPKRVPRADVVVCVHNALEQTARCLRSLLGNRDSTLNRVLVVDDASSPDVARVLDWFGERDDRVTVLRNVENLGYTASANLGLDASDADMTILLNSDTIAPPRWIDALIEATSTDPGIALVGPISNNAGFQSAALPDSDRLIPEETWRQASVVADHCERLFQGLPPIRVPLINGFCYGVTAEAKALVGHFDEIRFPRGYGEEDDFSMRAANLGLEAAIVPTCYVYHERGQSFSQAEREERKSTARATLIERHGEARFTRDVAALKGNPYLHALAAVLESRISSLTAPPEPVK